MKDIGNKYYQYAESRTSDKTTHDYKIIGKMLVEAKFDGTIKGFYSISTAKQGSANTHNHRLVTLKGFIRGALDKEKGSVPTELLACASRKDLKINSTPQLNVSEYEAAILYCESHLDSFSKQLGILLRTGIRYSELKQVIDYINTKNTGKAAVMSGLHEPKTHKVRTLYIPEMSMHMKNVELLEPINQRRFNKGLDKNFEFDSKITVHGTRGSFASYMYYHGMKVEEIAVAMGKVDLNGIPQSSLGLYLKMNNSRVHESIESIFSDSSRGQESKSDLKFEIFRLRQTVKSLRNKLNVRHNPLSILSSRAREIHKQVMKDE